MKNILRKGLLCTALGLSSSAFLSAQTKIEAESFVSKVDGSTEIVLENSDKTVGYFDEQGEKMVYKFKVAESGMYQFSAKFVSKDDGYLKFELEDGSYFNYTIEAYRDLGDNWWQLAQADWIDLDYKAGPSFYLEEGEHTLTITNGGIAINIDYFSYKASDVTDRNVVDIKTSPSVIDITPNETVEITPIAYNKNGEMIAVPATWSSNVENGSYTAGPSTGIDYIDLDMGNASKKIYVNVSKPYAKKKFVVSKYGALNTNDGAVRDKDGNKVSLMGPSLFWSCSAPLWWSPETVDFLVEKYNIQILRLPVAIAPCGSNGQTSCQKPDLDTWNKYNYIQSPEYTKKLVDDVVKACIENDIYVIIDFHEHVAQDWTNEAKEFFSYFASKWGEYPNVLYEIYNEPVCDDGTVVTYAKSVIPAIRAIDKDNIIIVGSSQFSRNPQNVTSAGEGYSNIAYTWHGYVQYSHQGDWNSHNDWNNGIPVIVTEWGVDGSGSDGGLINIYKQRSLINCFWSMSNLGGDDAIWSVLKSSCSKKADWSDSDMNSNGANQLKNAKGWVNFTPSNSEENGNLYISYSPNHNINLPQTETNLYCDASSGSGSYTYSWTQISGPSNATISSASSSETSVSGLVEGNYSFKLSVSDGNESYEETVDVTVMPEGAKVPEKFVLTICDDQTLNIPVVSTSIYAKVRGGSEEYTYRWKQIYGEDYATIANPDSAMTEISNLVEGINSFLFVVSDGENELKDTVDVIVYPADYKDPSLIDDVEDNDLVSLWGGEWKSFDDKSNSNNPSTVTDTESLPQDGRIKSEIKMGGTWGGSNQPYCGVELALTADGNGVDLSSCSKVTYKFKGSAHSFRAEMSAVKDDNFHGSDVSESSDWKEVTINWSSLAQEPDWGEKMSFSNTDIVKFSWQIKGDVGASKSLEIDDVTCVDYASSSALSYEKKPLKDRTNVEDALSDNVTIYPNPTADGKCVIIVAERSNVVISNVVGEVVKEFVAVPNFSNEFTISQKGVYVVSVGNVKTKLIVK